MLKNEELTMLTKAIVMLEVLQQYAINIDTFCEDTGMSIKDMYEVEQGLIHIQTTHRLKHIEASQKANAWNKAHPEQHRKHSRESERRRNRKEYQHEYYLKKKKEVK